MPSRPLKRARTTTRTYARARSIASSKKMTTISRPIVPRKQTVSLIYSEAFTIQSTGTVPGTYVFNANGLYDPDYSLGGHQPRGFDQIMSLYKRYRVKRVLCELWVDPADGSQANMVSLSCRTYATALTTKAAMMEDADATIRGVAGTEGGPSVVKLTKEIDIEKFAGIYDKADYSGTHVGNPLTSLYLHVNSCKIQNGVAGGDIYCRVRLTYLTEVSDVKDPGQS